MQTVSLSKNRELGIPRNAPISYSAPQTDVIQVSSQSTTIQRSDRILGINENSTFSSRTAADKSVKVPTFVADRSCTPPPTIVKSSITHVTTSPTYSKRSIRRGLPVKPSLFASPLPARTVGSAASKKGNQSPYLTNSKSGHQHSSPHLQKSSSNKLVSHKKVNF